MHKAARLLIPFAALSAGACMTSDESAPSPASAAASAYPAIGTIHRDDPALDALIAPGTRIERLAEGLRWAEGPVWVREGGYLLLSDVPGNKMYRWSESGGLSVFMDPSGYDGTTPGRFREPGTNGLIRGQRGTILAADHGSRSVVRIDLATRKKTVLASRYNGKRFNSPNDLALASDGSLYFTDPPYGLEGIDQSPDKEQPVNGVYRLDPDGTVSLVISDLSFPNGVILSPDEKRLYVAVSDPERAVVMVYDRGRDGSVSNGRVFADMTNLAKSGLPGLPDGMAIDKKGNLFATGPGGVHVFSPTGTRTGRIETGVATANCAFGEDGRTLFLAANNWLARVRTKTVGAGY
jgi:gluconolactonase